MSGKLAIAQLAPIVESVPPKGYGGTELVVSLLTEELCRRGHSVTLFASGDSQTAANLVSVADRALRLDNDTPVTRWQAFDQRALLKLRQMQNQFDVIHNHMGYQALPFLSGLDCPVVTTNHNPVKDYNRDIYLTFKDMPYVSISDAYRRINMPDDLNYVATVYNGIEVSSFNFVDDNKERDYLLFIGRICADKGTAEAIEIARRKGYPIKVAGKVDSGDRAYFNEKIKPWLDDPDVQLIGEVNQAQKVALYSNAYAVVYPINFDEPFGLVMAESLASGTPILALDRGSVKEVLSDGETAVIGKSAVELMERFGELATIDRAACRLRAQSLFSKERMTDGYEAVYHALRSQKVKAAKNVSPARAVFSLDTKLSLPTDPGDKQPDMLLNANG